MKEGRGGRPVGGVPVPALARRVDGGTGPEGHQGLRHGPVGRDRALGKAGRPRRVEDGGVVLGQHDDGRHRIAQRDDVLVALHAVRKRLSGGHARRDDRDLALCGRTVRPLDPLPVDDEHHAAGVLEGVVELALRPPRIEGDGDGADGEDGGKRHDPLGQVAHGDADPVALLDAEGVHQRVRQGVDVPVRLLERPALVLVDEEGRLVLPGAGKDVDQGGRRVLEDPVIDAVDDVLAQFEGPAGAGELGVRLFVADHHRMPFLPTSPSDDSLTPPLGDASDDSCTPQIVDLPTPHLLRLASVMPATRPPSSGWSPPLG